MKKIYLIALLASISLNLLSQTHWTKHPDNPVMLPGEEGEWDETIIAPGSVIYFDSTYHMWYKGSSEFYDVSAIGHATSPDGISWKKDTNNPVLDVGLEGEWDDGFLTGIVVLLVDSVFHMVYGGHSDSDNTTYYRIGHATSLDGINWAKDTNNPVMDKGPMGEWDEEWVIPVCGIHDGNSFHLWYIATSNTPNPSTSQHTGHATSPDGVNWTRDPKNPVISPNFNSWDNNHLAASAVVFDGNTYRLWYYAGDLFAWQIGYATSADGSSWNKYSNNPVMSEGPEGRWDEISVDRCAVIDSAGIKYKMWYCGRQAARTGDIGYAYSDTRDPYLTMISIKPVYDSTDTIVAEIVLDGTIYIVPEGTSQVEDSITKYMLVSVDALAEAETQILLTDLSIGHYSVIAISSLGFICTNPFFINLVENSKPPILEIETSTVTQGDTIHVTSDKDGTIYLVNVGTTPDNIFSQRNRIKDSIQVTAVIQVGFPTMDLFPKEYLFYAEDAFGQFSEASQVTVDPADPKGISITNASGIRIFPNPTYTNLTIQTDGSDQCDIRINSINGHLIFTGELKGTTNQIDLSTFQKGIYFITIRSKDFVTTRLIVKL